MPYRKKLIEVAPAKNPSGTDYNRVELLAMSEEPL